MNTLKAFFRHRLTIASISLVLIGAPVAVLAQQFSQAANNTTTNGAITAGATTVVLTSATAIAGSSFGAPSAGQCMYFADGNSPAGSAAGGNATGELARIASISSTTVTLNRGAAFGGSTPVPHATATRVFTAPCSFFQVIDPPAGSCTASTSPLPWINTRNGNVARCLGSSGWSLTNATPITYNSVAPGLPW